MLNLQQKLKLQQKLSPQQIQVIKMLEYPTIELEERIREEMEANPALDEGKPDAPENAENEGDYNDTCDEEHVSDGDGEGDMSNDFDLTEYTSDDDIPDYKLQSHNHSVNDKEMTMPLSEQESFHEHLNSQLELMRLERRVLGLATYLVGNIDDDGYLRRSIENMQDDLAFQFGVEATDDEMQKALEAVQTLEPAGVGARDLQECLVLQLKRRTQTPDIRHAIEIIEKWFEQFSKRQYDYIARRLGISEDEMRAATAEIKKLNPKPGNAYATQTELMQSQITPDFIVENDNGRLLVSLNNANIPDLRVSRDYTDMVTDFKANKANQTKQMRDAITFAKQKIDAAQWFIDALQQRNITLLNTMNAIVEHQREYFLEGDETKLRPMRLKDIAEQVGYDVSTISRVSNSKYVQTSFGIFPLKHFFVETMQTTDGGETSNRAIKKIISDLVASEDPRNPVNDDQLTDYLRKSGFVIARRTVAKYREQLGIQVARLRREI